MNSQEDRQAMPGQPAWYLLQCKSRQDFRAEVHLRNQGYTCFQPVIQAERLRHGKRQLLNEPLFPGYLFIRLDCTRDNWGPIRSTRGVCRLVGFNGCPLPVPDEVVATVKSRVAESPCITHLQPGDKVIIKDDAFADIEAIFSAFDGERRVIILLNLMQRQQQVVLPVSRIVKQDLQYA